MKERGKAVEIYSNDLFQDYSTSSSDLPCKKHPSSSSVGICAYCLKDRLVKLVCSDCGEQRLSSCSCSEISSNRNSCTVEVGSVGRISFLIENDKKTDIFSHSNSKPKTSGEKADEIILLKRSSSSCVEIKRKGGFWRIGKLFGKKREKACERSSVGGFEEKSDLWVVDYMGVSRSRSLCSFRGGGFFGSEDGTFSGARSSISAARSSISAARNSGVNGGLLFDPDRKSGFSEAEPRKSGFDGEKKDASVLDPEKLDPGFSSGANTRRVFSLKEGNFTTMDDSGFIDLKFDFPSESKADLSSVKMGGALSDSNSAFGSMRGSDFLPQDQCGGPFGTLVGDGLFTNRGSCRITVSDRGIKRSRKSFKSWRWIFRHNPKCREER
ncbi:hypothetical protein GH714_040032 [Hevea brasiliensis]|uniref:Uncharacterized protein n=1 Tax=Hevea brasiliensis TaxID=3981 RepID=A0A6A6MKA1_HEVBR|nr:hypothetical protein GH714_040032 [Hevea brasiliensis]